MNEVIDAPFIGHLPLFAGLSPVELRDIQKLFKLAHLQAGQALCVEGRPGNAMFVIERGILEVRKKTEQGDEQVVAKLIGPTVIGEMTLLDGAPRSASVIATEKCVLYSVPIAAFNQLRAQGHTGAFKVIRTLAKTLCERLRQTNEKIDLFFDDPQKALGLLQQRQRDLWYIKFLEQKQGSS